MLHLAGCDPQGLLDDPAILLCRHSLNLQWVEAKQDCRNCDAEADNPEVPLNFVNRKVYAAAVLRDDIGCRCRLTIVVSDR